MKRIIITLSLCGMLLPVFAQEAERNPEHLTMTMAWIADAMEHEDHRQIFVINGVVAFKTVDGLKRYLKSLPQNSSLTWAPGCRRMGNEPLLHSEDEMKDFREFCEMNGIDFILVPSG